MTKTLKINNINRFDAHKKPSAIKKHKSLCDLAFYNSLQPNVISVAGSGKIIIANRAACKLLGYSKKELLTKRKADILDLNECSVKKMLKERKANGHVKALISCIKKNKRKFSCEFSSAVFKDVDGSEKLISNIVDMSQSISKQKEIDIKKEKIVADNIMLAIAKQVDIDIKNKELFTCNISLALSNQKTIDARKEKLVAGNIALAILKQKEIDAKNERIASANIILALAKSDAMLTESNEKFFLATKFSTDLLWEWDLTTGEISVSNNIEELFGYTLKNKKGKATDWIHHVHREDKEELDKSLHKAVVSSANNWQHDFRFIRADGSIVHVLAKAGITRHPDGKATRLTGALQDLSKQKELEEKLAREIAYRENQLTENERRIKLIFNSSSDVLFDIDLVANKIVLSDAYEKEFGYKIINNITSKEDVFSHIHPGDKEALMQDYSRMLASEDTEWNYKFRFLRADNSVVNLLTSGIVLRNAYGNAIRRIGHLEDLNKQKVLEERLEQEIILKEKQIAEAAEEARWIERSELGKELHDNVNQLLGASKLYLSMAKGGGENSEMYLSRSSEYTLTAIEEIRKLSKKLTADIIINFGLLESIDNLIRDTMEVNPVKICCSLDSCIENRVNDKFRKNIFRIVQEQMNNILKHAKATEVSISLSQNKKFIKLTIADNGIGFDTGKKQKGIGIANIKCRATSFKGTADFISQPGDGCVLAVTFPVTDALLNTFTDTALNKSRIVTTQE